MVAILLDTGLIRVTVRYVKALKPGAPLSYYRRIPEELRKHYGGKTHIRQSLKTRDLAKAAPKAARLAAEHDALWASLRSSEGRTQRLTTQVNRDAAVSLLVALNLTPGDLHRPEAERQGADPSEALDSYFERRYGQAYLKARHEPECTATTVDDLVNPIEAEALRLLREDPQRPRLLLSDALRAYLKDHNKGAQASFITYTKRAIDTVISAVGDFPLTHYRREHAIQVKDALISKGNKTTTARRRLNVIKAVFSKGLLEFDLQSHGNPFIKLTIANEAEDAEKREAFTTEELKIIAKACVAKDDDLRHIVGLLLDSGARLGEIVGLRCDDVVLKSDTPHVRIRPYLALGRTLKNANSERDIPLVGKSRWAAERALKAAQAPTLGSTWLFPRYAKDNDIRTTSASVTLNKWLSKNLKISKTCHSFRHAMRDRMRHADVPEEFQNLIGGWGSRSIAQSYGSGYLLKQLHDQLTKVATY